MYWSLLICIGLFLYLNISFGRSVLLLSSGSLSISRSAQFGLFWYLYISFGGSMRFLRCSSPFWYVLVSFDLYWSLLIFIHLFWQEYALSLFLWSLSIFRSAQLGLFWLVLVSFDLCWSVLTCSSLFWYVLVSFDLYRSLLIFNHLFWQECAFPLILVSFNFPISPIWSLLIFIHLFWQECALSLLWWSLSIFRSARLGLFWYVLVSFDFVLVCLDSYRSLLICLNLFWQECALSFVGVSFDF